MTEETINDSFPDLKELENKTGKKIPESLLMWMKDAADCGDGWSSDVVDRKDQSSADCFTDKIHNLKQDMKWLRSADVRILRQLVAVHEGIEAMRWLMEERGTLTSRGSSLTGSLSSLVTVEEHAPSISPCRESQSPTCDQDLAEGIDEESADEQLSDSGNSNHQRYFAIMKSSETRKAFRSSHRSQDQFAFNTSKNSTVDNSTKSHPQDSGTASLKEAKDSADILRKALLRSSRLRRELKVDKDQSILTQESGETSTVDQSQDNRTASQIIKEEEEKTQSTDKLLLDYDAQWCWVESQDDVTFL